MKGTQQPASTVDLRISCLTGLMLLFAGAWPHLGHCIDYFIHQLPPSARVHIIITSPNKIIIQPPNQIIIEPPEYTIVESHSTGMGPDSTSVRIDWTDKSVSKTTEGKLRTEIGKDISMVISVTPFLRQKSWLLEWNKTGKHMGSVEMTIHGDKGTLGLIFQKNILKKVEWSGTGDGNH